MSLINRIKCLWRGYHLWSAWKWDRYEDQRTMYWIRWCECCPKMEIAIEEPE